MTTYVPETITRVRAWLDGHSVQCIDPPLTIFLGPGIDEWLDVEVGCPIADADIRVQMESSCASFRRLVLSSMSIAQLRQV